MLKTVYSQSSIIESQRLENLSRSDIARDYYNLPLLPTNEIITIAKIGVLNWNPITKHCVDKTLTYSLFTALDNNAYPEGEDPEYDYMSHEAVSPVTIQDINGVIYKVPMLLWFPLSDVAGGIISKQGYTLQKVLPFSVFIEKDYGLVGVKMNWFCKLVNFVGAKYIYD